MEKLLRYITGGDKVDQARERIQRLQQKKQRKGFLRASEKEQLDIARRDIRRHFLKVLGAGISTLALGGIGLKVLSKYACEEPKGILPPAPRQKPLVIPDLSLDQFQKQREWVDEQRKKTEDVLAAFQDASPRTQQLFKMFKERAFFSIPVGPKVTKRILLEHELASVGEPHQFEVVFMNEEYVAAMPAAIVWQWQENALRIAANIPSNEWLAILLYHELSHVFDFHFGNEDPHDSNQWMEGEIRAHEEECNLISHWQPSAYNKLIEEGVPLWEAGDKNRVVDLGTNLFPPSSKSSHMQALQNAALLTCVAFESAKQKGEDFKKVYKERLLPIHAK